MRRRLTARAGLRAVGPVSPSSLGTSLYGNFVRIPRARSGWELAADVAHRHPDL